MECVLVVTTGLVELLHELDHSLSSLHREAQRAARQFEVVTDGVLLLEHVKVDSLGVFPRELTRSSTQLEYIVLIDVRDRRRDDSLPSLTHNFARWQSWRGWLLRW